MSTGTSPGGAPQACGAETRLAVSVAHTAGLVVVAASRAAARIGVDVEWLDRRSRPEAIARRHFTPEEGAALSALPESRRRAAFLRAWTLKEAWGKAAGVGVPAALSRIGFPIGRLAAASPAVTRHSARGPGARESGEPWGFWTLAAGGTHTLGLAVIPAGRSTWVRVRSAEDRLRCRVPSVGG